MVKFNIYSYIIVTSFVSSISSLAYAVEFNTDMLDTEDTQNIDFSQFFSGWIYYAWYLSFNPQSQ